MIIVGFICVKATSLTYEVNCVHLCDRLILTKSLFKLGLTLPDNGPASFMSKQNAVINGPKRCNAKSSIY